MVVALPCCVPDKLRVIATTFAGEGFLVLSHLILTEGNQHFLEKIFQQLRQQREKTFS